MSDQKLESLLEGLIVSISVIDSTSIEEKAATIGEVMNSIGLKAESGSFSFMAFMELIADSASNGEEDEELSGSFSNYQELEKQIFVKLMYLVYQEGLLINSSDLEKRKRWFERLTNLNSNLKPFRNYSLV